MGEAEVPEGVGALAAGHGGEAARAVAGGGRPRSQTVAGASESQFNARSVTCVCFSGRVRGLERQRGQQEDLRGPEEARPAVDGGEMETSTRNRRPFEIWDVSHHPCFFLFVSSNVVLQTNVITIDHYNKRSTFCQRRLSLFSPVCQI